MLLFSVTAFALYIALSIHWFGIPESISDTYYRLESRKEGSGWVFTIWTWVILFTLIPVWMDVSTENTQFLVFLSCAGLGFVGAAPQFKVANHSKVHFAGAGICALSAVLWAVFSGLWFIPLITLPASLCFVYRWKKQWLFWLEMAAFTSTYLSVFIKSITN